MMPSLLDRWVLMWLVAGAIYAMCKALTWWTAPPGAPIWRQVAYVFAWPGMDAPAFLFNTSARRPVLSEWAFALTKLGFGAALLWVLFPCVSPGDVLLRGWVGMVGLVFVLHFGLFHLLSLTWRMLGIDAKPIMDWPVAATSVSEFWGQRWNLAFRDLTHRFLFRPLTTRFGARPALAIGFLVSGLLHDAVISLPAGSGYGRPTLFFVIQALPIFVERSTLGKRLGLGRGVIGWLFTMTVLLGPVMLLFHAEFATMVVAPFVEWVQL